MKQYLDRTLRPALDACLSGVDALPSQRDAILRQAQERPAPSSLPRTGVIIAFTREEAFAAVRDMMEGHVFGASGDHIVIEEFLEGPEVSVLSFTDGKTVVPMVSSMDHKRIGDNDTGLNTGGMGTIAPNPYYTEEIGRRN